MLTSHPVSSSSEVASPCLPAPVNNSANSENVVALAAILRDVLSPGGSSESARATRLASRQVRWLCGSSKISCVRCTCSNQAFVHGRGFRRRSAFGVSCSQTSHEKRDEVDCSVATGKTLQEMWPSTRSGTCSVEASFVTAVCLIPSSPSVSSAQPEVRRMDISVRDVLKVTEC